MKFFELARIPVSKAKNIVVSRCDDNGQIVPRYVIAQQVTFHNEDTETAIFLKNSIAVDKAGLMAIRDMLTSVIEML